MNLCYSHLKFDEKCVLPDTVDYLKNLICAQEGHLLRLGLQLGLLGLGFIFYV